MATARITFSSWQEDKFNEGQRKLAVRFELEDGQQIYKDFKFGTPGQAMHAGINLDNLLQQLKGIPVQVDLEEYNGKNTLTVAKPERTPNANPAPTQAGAPEVGEQAVANVTQTFGATEVV